MLAAASAEAYSAGTVASPGLRVCAACRLSLPDISFSRSQRRKGAGRRCVPCVAGRAPAPPPLPAVRVGGLSLAVQSRLDAAHLSYVESLASAASERDWRLAALGGDVDRATPEWHPRGLFPSSLEDSV